jgi:hypothetical protein
VVLRQLYPDNWDIICPGIATWVSNGTVFAYHGVAARTGVALLADLSVSDELLRDISDFNRTMGGGSFWLAPGQEGHWHLVWATGMLLMYFESDQFAVEYIVQVARGAPLVLATYQERFGEKFGGRPWWQQDIDNVGYGAQALVLLGLIA